MKEQLASASTRAQLRKVLHPPGLMQGLESAKNIRKTVYDRINSLVAANKSHRDVAAECDQFSLMNLAPAPYKTAVDPIALHQGWSREALWQGVIANYGWLENNRSVAVNRPGDQHRRVLPEPCFFASPPSFRNSSLKKFVCHSLFQTPAMPALLSTGAAVSGEGTVKGHQGCLFEHGRGGLENDEVSKVYATSFSSGEAGRGLHLATKPKLPTLVNGEDDVVTTGHGQVPLRAYVFRHVVYGQYKPMEEVLTDYAFGFPKRFHEVWCGVVQNDPTQQCEHSIAFLKDGHDFMARYALPHPAEHYPDGFAADFERGVLDGIKDFLEDHPNLSDNYRQVLEFADTHLARLANAVMRACQHCETVSGVDWGGVGVPGERVAWNV